MSFRVVYYVAGLGDSGGIASSLLELVRVLQEEGQREWFVCHLVALFVKELSLRYFLLIRCRESIALLFDRRLGRLGSRL